jgi:SRSO17 transposase
VGHGVTSVDLSVRLAELDRLHRRIAGRFRRAEPRNRVRQYLSGLAAGLDRTNGWTLAEQAGAASPDGMQRLLRWADWDVDAVRDDIRDYVMEHLADPQAVLVVDDYGFTKKGLRSAGVARQYSKTEGRIANCQVGVFLAYHSGNGHALIDRQLYLPQTWTGDPVRCRAAGVPDDVAFSTKPQIATAMLARALDAGAPVAWVTADETYGPADSLRAWLEDRRVGYVMALRGDDTVITREGAEARPDEVITAQAPRSWRRISTGADPHSGLGYDWARTSIRDSWPPGRGHWLVGRRDRGTAKIDYFVCYGPRRATLLSLAAIAGAGGAVKECLRQATDTAGLGEYQVRDWRAWHAHITLSMAAHSWLAVATAATSARQQPAAD